MKNIMMATLLITLLTACTGVSAQKPLQWSYGVGSNVDKIRGSKTVFFRNGQMFHSDIGAGSYSGASTSTFTKKEYYWVGGSGWPTDGEPIPDHAIVDVVSFHDQKRYRIDVQLPKDLEQQMQKVYEVNGKKDQRNWLYFGLAPGGYYEVLLMGGSRGVSPDILLSRGIAKEVTDDWYDKEISVAEQYGTGKFLEKYSELLKKNPIPIGMEWAPIMDAYRAAQPRIDTHPLN
ncbi:hypothetical protein C7R88_16170 (plasmid) [Plesiomonas shigelloides]|uniref:DUF2931 family protein n=1 Tax=Plesiomonas shigelloides TaxID=703 RepID=UPI000D12831C|nr:DUF2931 family protein [Plesiomonas shigelloides]AVQ88861.1 hypothetical protein C7R88_16170 [Plesiomonas shigelloides]